MHYARTTLRAQVDSVRMVSAPGDAPRVEGHLTSRSGESEMPQVVVTFFAADGSEVGTATAPVQADPGRNAGSFSVTAPHTPTAAAGYRYYLRWP